VREDQGLGALFTSLTPALSLGEREKNRPFRFFYLVAWLWKPILRLKPMGLILRETVTRSNLV
jgi:hypothetical protein